MAAKIELTQETLKAAVEKYCEETPKAAYSLVGDGDKKDQYRIMINGNPDDQDIYVWLEDGKLKCSDPLGWGEDFNKSYILATKTTAAPRPPRKENIPKDKQSSSLAPVVSPGSTLTLEKVRDYFCKNATDEECAFALEVCAIRGLNPFRADCYLVKYEGKNPKLEILVSNSFLLKKAMANPDFKYFKAGVTVQKEDGTIDNVIREYAYPGETLLGGWAEMGRRSIEVPFRVEIPMAGNKKESKWWVQTPGHMIRKTASSQVAREAFPEDLAGLYDVDEMGFDPSKEVQGA